MSEDAKAKWFCLKCKGLKNEKKPSGSSTQEITSVEKGTEEGFPGYSTEDILKSVNQKLDLIRNISSGLETLKETTAEIRASQDFLSDQYDKFENALKCLPSMEQELKKLRETLVEKDKEILELKIQVNKLEQYGRNKNLEVNEVAEVKGENVEVVMKIAEKFGVQLEERDIEIAHRLPKTKTEQRPANIIVQFANRKVRNRLLEARKKVVTNAEVTGHHGGRIYISENLSFYYRNLLKTAKDKAKSLNYKYIWYKYGAVRVRKEDNSKVIVIDTEEDLVKIK
ncbi:uncharacterized protein LOC128983961 [Macrosteles quadrilineatus]|uniref:uncharacterized protein LOC128983961 n=1 Tax=Macrosteles quadrilineatus TaxID=74068 RepID=UPI0023E16A23|nr:uncharacterized protein LOC128983961 [Macrosteles quadrilineatus]